MRVTGKIVASFRDQPLAFAKSASSILRQLTLICIQSSEMFSRSGNTDGGIKQWIRELVQR
jgi:hypothetical protein